MLSHSHDRWAVEGWKGTDLIMRIILPEEMLWYDDAFIECEVSTEEVTLLSSECFTSLEAAGLEEQAQFQPSHGYQSVPEYVHWFSDGEDSRYEVN